MQNKTVRIRAEASRPLLMSFMSMLSDNHLLVSSWCDARRGNAICMPCSHLPATKIDPLCPLYLLTDSHLCTHTRSGVLASFEGPCVCVFFSSSLPLLWFDMISFFICLKSICNPMQELIPLHTPDTHTHTPTAHL